MSTSPGSIVVVRGGALGDVLLGVPALRALRERFPATRLHLVAPMPQAGLLRYFGIADTATALDDPALVPLFLERPALAPVPATLRRAAVAVVWLHGGDLIASHLVRLGASRVVAAPALPEEDSPLHAADWLIRTLAPLGVDASHDWDRVPWLHAPPGDDAGAGSPAAVVRDGAPYLVLHPGSGSGRKNWPAPHWAATVAAVRAARPMRLVVTAGEADDAALAALEATGLLDRRGQGPATVLRSPELPRLAAVLRGAALFLGNDSGVTHLAAGLGVPSVAVFGASDPARWRPRGPGVRVLGSGGGNWPDVAAVVEAAGALLGA